MNKYVIAFGELLVAALAAGALLFIMLGCSSVIPKGSPMTGHADLIDKVIDGNPSLSPTDKAILKAGSADLRYADKVIADQDKEIDKTKDKLVSEAKEAGAGKLTYALIGLAILAAVVYILHKFKLF